MTEDPNTLGPIDRFCLQNAEVLHMLQNYKAAEFEISHIGPEKWDHPDVLHLRCRIFWGVRNIALALSSVTRFIELYSDQPFGYVFKAQMLAYDGRPEEAFDLLLGVHKRFPRNNGFPLVMAECAAQLARWDEALNWLTVAISISPYLKEQALDIRVFEPIRAEIEAIQVHL